MTETVARLARRKRPRKWVYVTVRKALLIDHKTGEVLREPVGVFVPRTNLDHRIARERKYHVGRELRADFKAPRNVMFYRKAHYIARLLTESVDGYAGMGDFHDVLKRLQRESGLWCEPAEIDASGVVDAALAAVQATLGPEARAAILPTMDALRSIPINIPRSLSFDEMDEAEWDRFYGDMCEYIGRVYFSDMTPEQVDAMIEAFGREEHA